MPKIVVEGPDGRKFAFPDTMPQSEINAFMRNKYGTKSRNETVDQYLARVVREQDATQARARDIDRQAAEAGRAEGERAAERMGVTNPLMMAVAAPAIGMAQQAGARPVYEREGTILPDEAAGLSAINAAGFFIPGTVNQRFGQRLEEGRRQEPVAAFAGDIAGGFPSGEVIGLGLQKAGQAIAPGIAALGRLFQGRQSISPEVQVVGDLMQVPRGAAEAIPAGSNPYLNRRSMRPEAPAGPGEATLALREEWRPLMPAIAPAAGQTVGVPPVRAQGLPAMSPEATNTLVGAGIGAAGPAETPEERARNIVVGAGLGYGGTRLGAMGRRTVGAEPAPANMPRTPRDAMRFETPGSPEYEAALAKGLDMSQAGRRQRGIDQGYDMDRVLYHGTIDDFEAFDPQKSEAKFGVHVGTSRAAGDRARAKGEMEAGRRNNWQKGGNADPLTNQQVIPIVAKFKKPLRLPDLGAWTPSSVANAIAKQYGIRPASNRPADVMNAIRKAGYDSIVYKNVSEGRGSDSYIIFDPAEIRSVNAVFDPDNAASPVLTAGSGGYFNRQSMRLPGVGPTAREAELAETWRETRPIVQTARTAASSGEQAADIAVQSRAPGDIARAKDAKAALIREIETAQALRAGMDTPEDARLADALEALKENTSDPLLISSQIGAAKTSLERLLTDLGRPTMPSTMMRAPQRPPLRRTFSAEEEARLAPETPEPPSRTRYAEGEVPPVKGMGFGASTPTPPQQAARFETPGSPEYQEALLNGDIRPTSEELYDALRQARKDGNTDVTEIRAIAEAVDRIENGAIVEVISDAFKKFPVAREVADRQAMGYTNALMSDERAAIAIVQRAIAEARLQNKNPEAVFNEALTAYASRFSDPEDAAFMRQSITDLMNMGNLNKATSSTLLAAAPFAAVGGAGMTAERELGARMKEKGD